MAKFIAKVLEWLGATSQLRADLSALLALALVFAADMEEKIGPGNGAEKRSKAIDAFFAEVAKEGGIDLPSWMSGPVARKLFGMLLDFVVSLANGEKPKNS